MLKTFITRIFKTCKTQVARVGAEPPTLKT